MDTAVGGLSRLGARIAMYEVVRDMPRPPGGLGARSVDCDANPNLCEKPVSENSVRIPLIVGVW